MRRLLSSLIVFAGLLYLAGPVAADEDCRVYVFDDSLSDVGEKSPYSLYQLSGLFEPPSPPYAEGRYSDGRVWAQYFKRFVCREGELISYATGGAFTDFRNVNVPFAPDAGGLVIQLDHVDDDNVVFTEDDVILLWAGANDYIFDTLAGSPPDPSDIVGNIANAIKRLAARGATRFVVPNMPALGRTPLAASDTSGALATALNRMSDFHNLILAGVIADLKGESLDVRLVDVAALFDAILTDPGDFGFDNTSIPCLIQNLDLSRDPTGACPELDDTYDAQGVFFWDLLHPTTAVHRLIASTALGAFGDDDDDRDRRHRKRRHDRRHHVRRHSRED